MKKTKHKKSYLGTITDLSVVNREVMVNESPVDFNWDDDTDIDWRGEIDALQPPKGVADIKMSPYKYKEKQYKNRRNKLFCSCGHSFEVELSNLRKKVLRPTNPFSDNQKSKWTEIQDEYNFKTIKCTSCKKEFSNFDDLNIISSKLYNNCISKRYRVFNDGDKIRIVHFSVFIGINQYTNKLFFTKQSSSICYNKITKRFFISYGNSKKNKTVRGVGINQAKSSFSSIIEVPYCNSVAFDSRNKTSYFSDFDKEYLSPLNRFLKELLGQIDDRDSKRISEYLKGGFFDIKKKNEYFSPKDKVGNNVLKNGFGNKYLTALNLVSSIIQVPSLSTVLFTKGSDFFGELMSLEKFPRPSFLKKNKPTSPKSIFEEIIKQSKEQDYVLHSKSFPKEYREKENKYRKNLRDINLRQSLVKEISKLEDIKVLSFLFERGFDKAQFYNLCDTYGSREVLDIFYSIFYNKFHHYDVEFDFKKINHITKIYKKIEHNKTEGAFGDILFSDRGKPKDSFSMNMYEDTFRIAENLGLDEENIYGCRTWEEVVDLHDNISERASLLKNEKFNKAIKEFAKKFENIKENKIDGVTFNLISNIVELEKESQEMHHCVKTYANGLAKGRHLIFSVEDTKDGSRATLELSSNSPYNDKEDSDVDSWSFTQLKAKYNRRSTKNIINTSIQFCQYFLPENQVDCTVHGYSLKSGDLCVLEDGEEDTNQNAELFW